MNKGSIQEGDITIVNVYAPLKKENVYAPHIGAPQYIRQMPTATKGEINTNTIILGGLQHSTFISGQIIQTETQ